VRLHPRYGTEPDPDASKLGGAFLWPRGEPWPVCELHGIPYVTGLQLRADDCPAVKFRPGADLLQLLWCPRDHQFWIKPTAVWRRRARVGDLLPAPPEPRHAFMSYVPVPCVVLPERVTEYPPWDELAEETQQKLDRGLRGRELPAGITSVSGFYSACLSVCPGTKAGGYVRWLQGPEAPACKCGREMDHLLTIASDEFDGASYHRWMPVEDGPLWDGTARATYGWADAPGLQFGDLGKVYFFVCRHCEGWPITHAGQC
jgi:hypothetical protein